MKKIKISSCFVFVAMFCFIFTGCSFSDDGSGNYSSFGKFINDIQVVSLGDGDETGEYAYEMLNTLTINFLNKLQNEYGSNASNAISRSVEDTHLNAVMQDNWKWKIDTSNQEEQIELQNYLQYQFTMILLGNEPLTFSSKEFVSPDYLQLKANGEFSENNLKSLANNLAHIGFFYYELDNIAEFVLNDVIGDEIISRDLLKFADKNNNKTFDYVEHYIESSVEKINSIILSYNSTFEKEESKSKNGVWNRIEWGNGQVNTPPTIVDDIIENGQVTNQGDIIKATEIAQEKALSLIEIEQMVDVYVKSLTTNTALQQEELLKFKQQNSADLAIANYSGFKNYQNTVYYILYSLMHNFTFTHAGETSPTIIENVLTMTHKPNLDNQVVKSEDMIYDESAENPYFLPFDNYKSVLITSNQLCGTSSFYLVVKSNMPNQTLELDINVRYQFTSDAYREYIGPYSGTSKLVEGKLMTMQILPNDESGYYAMLGITPENYQSLIDRGMKLEEQDITPLARMGVYNIVLSKYVPYIYGDLEKNDIFNFKEGYIANPSTTYQGSSFNYQNSMTDFLEIVFDVKGSYEVEPEFTFAFIWM